MLERAQPWTPDRSRLLFAWLVERRVVLAWWAGSRAIVVAGILVIHWLRAPRGYFGHAIFAHILGPLEAWDGIWYRAVAARGYLLVPGHQSDPAFFPFYPLLLKLVGLTGMSVGAAGVVLSNLLFAGALLAFDALGHELFPDALARRATLLLAVFPTGYVCSMLYPESLVLLAFALAGLFAARGRWLACAAAAAVAALARPEGVLLVLPIAAALASQWRRLDPDQRGRGIAAVLSAPAAAISFPVYLWWTLHDPFAWSEAQQAWGRSFRIGGLWHSLSRMGDELSRQPWAARDIGFGAVTLLLLAAAWRAGAPRTWILLGALLVVVPLGSGSFNSDARFALLALPAYWGLAWLASTRAVFTLLALLCAGLLAAATVTLPLVFP